MPAFRYVAIDPAGQTVRGQMEAPTEADVITRLQRAGNIPMRAEPARAGWTSVLHRPVGRTGMTRQDVTEMTRELSLMLGAGQDLDRSLRFLAETTRHARVRTTIEALRQTVRDGGSLATALGRHPGSFSRLYIGLVRAGEAGGTLGATLERLAALLERERELASSIVSALVYPALLTVAAVGSIVLLLTTVLPQFVPLFEQSGAPLPWATRLLIDAGGALSSYGLPALAVTAAAGLLLRQAMHRPTARLSADRWLLRLPVFGTLLREILAARFTQTLGTLLTNGVPLIAALAIVQEVVGNRAGVQAIQDAASSAKGGAGLARPIGQSGVFPARTGYLLQLGEETAQLGPMALRAAAIHEERTRLMLQRLVGLLVPAITIAMGGAIAGIVSALLLAMLGLNDLAN